MKTIGKTIFVMLILLGICLAGGEAETLTGQFTTCVVGWLMAAAGFFGLAEVLRR